MVYVHHCLQPADRSSTQNVDSGAVGACGNTRAIELTASPRPAQVRRGVSVTDSNYPSINKPVHNTIVDGIGMKCHLEPKILVEVGAPMNRRIGVVDGALRPAGAARPSHQSSSMFFAFHQRIGTLGTDRPGL
jgi:hypothetical protein